MLLHADINNALQWLMSCSFASAKQCCTVLHYAGCVKPLLSGHGLAKDVQWLFLGASLPDVPLHRQPQSFL